MGRIPSRNRFIIVERGQIENRTKKGDNTDNEEVEMMKHMKQELRLMSLTIQE